MAHSGIQPAGGLVQEEDGGASHQLESDVDALALSTADACM